MYDFAFGSGNFIESITHKSDAVTKSFFNYSRNQLGHVTDISSSLGAHSFAYDLNSYLSSANRPISGAETYTYDSLGNRITDQNGNYVYDLTGQLLSEDYKNNYTYDNNGNLILKIAKGTGEVTKYSYSSENQLIKIEYSASLSSQAHKSIDYTYDALARRIEKKVVDQNFLLDTGKTFTRKYAYDGQEVLLEFDGTNSLLARYTHSTLRTDDVLSVNISSAGVAQKLAQSSGTYFFLKDSIGTTTDIIDGGGNVVQRYAYSAFGDIRDIVNGAGVSVVANPVLNTSYTFTGRELDKESGLYYYRARFYDSSLGRFLQQDPEPGKLSMPSTVINKYIYVSNNPLMFTDPTGRFLFAALFAFSSLAITSGSAIGALAAVGATFAGALAASAIYSGISGKGGDFWKNAESIFNVSAGFLGLSAIGGHFWGGGIQEVGANSWYQGMVGSKTNILGFGGGDLTIGTSAYFGGGYQDLLRHSLGHTMQFMALSAAGPQGAEAYIGLGALGFTSAGQWWEATADWLGSTW
ncbi:MAG: RHS repeat-associated core domain-containing protein [Pseudomonadota bacterium]|nr:RHS repeat-associated core domain-containing protein [Pseudomonadota bacterium]